MEQQHGIYTPFTRQELMPKEERLEVKCREQRLKIGIPKEQQMQEHRVCLTPDAVAVLVANGHEVTVETGAGQDANHTDQEYSEAGASIGYEAKEVFSKSLVLKVEPPTKEEVSWMEPDSTLISGLQLNMQTRTYFESLSQKRITTIAFEYIKDEHGHLPVVRSIGEIAGINSILIAAELLASNNGGTGVLMGGVAGVRPTEVVIIGGGSVGEYAARAATGLGASVRVFDRSLTRLRRLQNNMGFRIPTSTIDPKELKKSLMRCDVAIGAIRSENRTPVLVSSDMVESMKQGAVIIDMSIDLGGCFETSEVTTHNKPTVLKHGVIHYGVTNSTSRVARTASKALSNFFLPYLLSIGKEGGFEEVLRKDAGLRSGVYLYKGRLTKENISQWFSLPFKDINLLIV